MNETSAVKPEVAGQSNSDAVLDLDFDHQIDEDDLGRMQADLRNKDSAYDFDAPDAPYLAPQRFPDEPDEPDEATKAAVKNKLNLLIVAVIVVAVLALGAFGYFAYKVLGGNNQSASNRSQLSQDVAAVGATNTNEFTSSDADVEALAQSLGAGQPKYVAQNSEPVESAPQVQQEIAVVNSGEQFSDKEILITQGVESLGVEAVKSPDVGVPPKAPSEQVVTEEERLYDNLLSSVEGMDVPPEAIKIDQGVINRRLENQRINTLEQEIKEARSGMAGIQSAVEGIRNQVSGFAQVIEKNSTEQAAISESITKLADQVNKATALQEKELEAIKAAVAKAQKSADAAVAVAGDAKAISRIPATAEQKVSPPVAVSNKKSLVPVAASPNVVVREPIAAATAPVSPTKVFSEQPTPAVVQARTVNQSASGLELPAHCNGTRVSANWRVKGVNSHSAYVVRSQDQQGMYLKVGVDVPGYGQVQAFDANSRSVCTTNGLIRR